MATFEKRPGGWHAKVRKAGVYRTESGFKTKAEAIGWAARIEAEIAATGRGDAPDVTFSRLIERYIAEITRAKRGARAEALRLSRLIGRKEGGGLEAVKPDPIAEVPLRDLNETHFAAWRDRRLKAVSAASVRREWATLNNACNIAIREWKWLRENPMRLVRKPEAPTPRQQRVPEDVIDRLLLATGYEYDRAPETQMARVGAAMLFALETGMRAGEICALRPADVSSSRKVAHLERTKNGHSRDVPLSKEALRILRQLESTIVDGGTIFGITAANLDALFRKAKARALVSGIHFHDTRREALTRLAAKVDVMTLAKISGHKDLRILQNTYYAPDMADVVALLD
ncbi:tyrosine-type recombinase/integrase [Chitiniphilus shinanonensis]|uniref:tyrosine-type recombinase/integrase n=1 Tax=Chitiniphilus shinanonensis TaxID=553088 RepID=UPI0030702949